LPADLLREQSIRIQLIDVLGSALWTINDLSPRVHLSCRGAPGTDVQLQPAARDLSSVSEFFPNQVIPADDLARVMVDVAIRDTSKPERLVFENRDIMAMAASAGA
jgi:hypothetical protein